MHTSKNQNIDKNAIPVPKGNIMSPGGRLMFW